MTNLYHVYYYQINNYSIPTIYLAGIYDNLEAAKLRMSQIIPDYKQHYRNTVFNHDRIGWINEFQMGEMYQVDVRQPTTSVYLF